MEIKKRNDENSLQYVWRIGNAKESGELDMSWQEIANLFNSQLCDDEEEYKTEAGWRKPFQAAKMFYDQNVFSISDDERLNQIQTAKQSLFAEKVKLRDERNELSRLLREQARRETYVETVRRAFVEDVVPFSPAIHYDTEIKDNAMIIHLTDIHSGLGIDNALNKYNESEMYQRITNYFKEIRDIAKLHNCNECVLVLGGDLVSGLIHTSVRLENNENIIQQTKKACKYIAEFVNALRTVFTYIRIYSVSGNHSRITPSIDSHLNGEELDSLVPFYLSAVFANDDGVMIYDNEYGDYIATFTLCGHTWCAVHGDKDNPATIASDMAKLLGSIPDGILMGHRHTNSLSTDGKTKIVQSGSICGTDRYAFDKRLFGTPEQMVIITDKRKTIKCLYDIQL